MGIGVSGAIEPQESRDLVVGRMMGAYTSASATGFNHFPKARVVSVDG